MCFNYSSKVFLLLVKNESLIGAEEMAQWFKTLTPIQDLGLVLKAYMLMHNCLGLQFQGI